MNIIQVGNDVQMSASGTVDLGGLSFINNGSSDAAVNGSGGFAQVGPAGIVTVYGGLTGPGAFGTGLTTFPADSGSGDLFGFQALNFRVPFGYVRARRHSTTPRLRHSGWHQEHITIPVVPVPTPILVLLRLPLSPNLQHWPCSASVPSVSLSTGGAVALRNWCVETKHTANERGSAWTRDCVYWRPFAVPDQSIARVACMSRVLRSPELQ